MEIYKIVLVEKQKFVVSFDFTDYLPWLRSLYISNQRSKKMLFTTAFSDCLDVLRRSTCLRFTAYFPQLGSQLPPVNNQRFLW